MSRIFAIICLALLCAIMPVYTIGETVLGDDMPSSPNASTDETNFQLVSYENEVTMYVGGHDIYITEIEIDGWEELENKWDGIPEWTVTSSKGSLKLVCESWDFGTALRLEIDEKQYPDGFTLGKEYIGNYVNVVTCKWNGHSCSIPITIHIKESETGIPKQTYAIKGEVYAKVWEKIPILTVTGQKVVSWQYNHCEIRMVDSGEEVNGNYFFTMQDTGENTVTFTKPGYYTIHFWCRWYNFTFSTEAVLIISDTSGNLPPMTQFLYPDYRERAYVTEDEEIIQLPLTLSFAISNKDQIEHLLGKQMTASARIVGDSQATITTRMDLYGDGGNFITVTLQDYPRTAGDIQIEVKAECGTSCSTLVHTIRLENYPGTQELKKWRLFSWSDMRTYSIGSPINVTLLAACEPEYGFPSWTVQSYQITSKGDARVSADDGTYDWNRQWRLGGDITFYKRGMYKLTAKLTTYNFEYETPMVCVIAVGMEDTSICLPQSLRDIDEEAFANTNSEIVLLPYEWNSIQSRAFANNKKLVAVFTTIYTDYIADDAFVGCPVKVIFCAPGSYAARWAEQHGYHLNSLDGFDEERYAAFVPAYVPYVIDGE